MRILYLTNIPSPYRVAFFNELSKHCELTVVFERESAKDRNNSWMKDNAMYFNYIFLKGIKVGTDSVYSLEIKKIIRKNNYDLIVIGGYSTPTGMLTIRYLKRKKIPFILNCDGGLIKQDNLIKYKIKKYFISSAQAWLSTGENTNKYLMHYGANKKNIYLYSFTSISEDDILDKIISDNEKSKLREELKINEKKIVVSVGQFIYRKGFDLFIKISKNINDNVGVYIIGGQATEEYISMKKNLDATNIHFVGFKSKEELKKYYYAADIFALPTREDIWGLVINEAMAYGLPVITTDKCVAGKELIEDDKNGYIIKTDDQKSLAHKINYILIHDDLRKKMSENNLKKIHKYTIENMAKEHIKIFEKIIKRR